MRAETTIRAVESIAKVSRKGRRVNGLFRLLANPEVLWKQAYANLYSNSGAITKGVNDTTLDGFSMDRVGNLIQLLYAKEYRFAPVRRAYIAKSNNKLRPLGIPTGDDKLVQEAVRIILERIYEPVFSSNSHGFRPKRSCHTALMQVDKQWLGVKWIIEFDIKGFFDNISHNKMIEILERKIDDKRIISLVRQMLKAGYMEEWKWNPSYSGTPQGGVIAMAQFSFFATLAAKHKTNTPKVMRQLRLHNQAGYGVTACVQGKPRIYRLFRLADHKRPTLLAIGSGAKPKNEAHPVEECF